jgi:uncharacterized protein YndB with AHSA1/START domain
LATTRSTRHIAAPRANVYRALLDPTAVERWKVPEGMSSRVHSFDPREGGAFRISLTYRWEAAGKTSGRTDTYHGHFARLIPDEEVVEVVEFETDDPALQGEMTITTTLADVPRGTDVLIVHDCLPCGVDPADNETGTRMSLDKLAALLQQSR